MEGIPFSNFARSANFPPRSVRACVAAGAGRYLEQGLIRGFHVPGSYLKEELRSEQAQWAADFIAGLEATAGR